MGSVKSSQIAVRISLHGVFRRNRFKSEVRQYAAGVSVREIVADLELPEHLLGIVIVNDVHAGTEDVLTDGDSLSFYPLLDGG